MPWSAAWQGLERPTGRRQEVWPCLPIARGNWRCRRVDFLVPCCIFVEMLTQEKAEQLGRRWIDLWNERSVDEYLTQYRDDVVLVSSIALRLFPESNGRLSDKKLLKEYWELVRLKLPQYKFVLERITCYENKVLVFYRTIDGRTKVIAILTVDSDDMIYKVEVSYV